MAESNGLLEIVKICAEYGVASYECDGLRLTFSRWAASDKSNQAVQSNAEGRAPEARVRMDDLLVENPELYEEELLRATDQ